MELDKPANDDSQQRQNGEAAAAILFKISNQAHEYVKSLTQHLTFLRNIEDTPDPLPPHPPDTSSDVDSAHSSHDAYKLRCHDSSTPPPGAKVVPPFAKDHARIVHSPSFRRLQGKTQLIPAGENEFFRTRLTHSIEVADIATRIARKLNAEYSYFRKYPIDYDLVSCAALLHDIGHPPFGHSGEDMLNHKMLLYGGFEGNAQTLRIVTRLENRLGLTSNISDVITNPRGLNLTVGTLASILKYDKMSTGPKLEGEKVFVSKGYYPTEKAVVDLLHERLNVNEDTPLYTIECQIMDMADDIAYSAYDLEDTLEAGIVTPFDLMSIDDKTLAMIQVDVQASVKKREPHLAVKPENILKHLSDVFGTLLMYGEVDNPYQLDKSRLERLAFVGRTYGESVQHAKNALVRRQYLETLIELNINSLYLEFNSTHPFLSTLKVDVPRLLVIESMKAFNFHKVITSRRLQLQHRRNKKIIGGIFDALAREDGGALLSDFQRQEFDACDGDKQKRMRLISDIVSSLTDLEALNLYDQLNSSRHARFWSYSR